MSGMVTAWLIVAAYLAIGIVVYVRMVPVCYRRKLAENEFLTDSLNEKWSAESAQVMAGWRAALWPYTVVHELVVRRINRWAWRPVEEQRERLARLKQDREDWHQKSFDESISVHQRRMAADIVTTLDDILHRESL